MNKKSKNILNLLILSLFVSIGVMAYLTYHHYSLKLGLQGSTVCQISSTINCDSAAASQYAEFAGIPIALFGFVFALLTSLYFIFVRFEWLNSTDFSRSLLVIVFGTSFAYSVFLAFISFTQLQAICPFCVFGYILAIIQFSLVYLYYKAVPTVFTISDLTNNSGLIIGLFTIPFFAWMISKNISEKYGIEQLKTLTTEKIELWKRAQEYQFDLTLGLAKGNKDSKNVIVEFADFKCPHCKVAAQTLKKFHSLNPDAYIVFRPFPLDQNCNENIGSKGDNSRCTLSSWVMCSEKHSLMGWAVHDWFFDRQEKIIPLFGEELEKELSAMSAELKLDFDAIKKCAASGEILELLGKMNAEAKVSQVQGTPTIYLNKRKLEAAQIFDVLKKATSLQ